MTLLSYHSSNLSLIALETTRLLVPIICSIIIKKNSLNQTTSKQTLRLNFCYLKIIHILHPLYHPKIIGHILKNKEKNKCDFIHQIMSLIIVKMKMKMKNRSHRYDINIHTSRHKINKKSVSVMIMRICNKRQLSNSKS